MNSIVTEDQKLKYQRIFTALNFHFWQKTYDWFKYQYNIHQPKTITNHYFVLCKKYPDENEFVELCVANILANQKKIWISSLMTPEAKTKLLEYRRRQESLSYIFEKDVDFLINFCYDEGLKLTDLILIEDVNTHPKLLKIYRQNRITLETMIILNDILMFSTYWNIKKLSDTIIWPNLDLRMRKFKPFMNYELEKFNEILKRKIKGI